MTIAFSCQRCETRFKVPDNLSGKKARCKKCGQQIQVPQAIPKAEAVAVSGMFRLGSVQEEQLAGAKPEKAAPKRRKRAPKSLSLRLAPIPSQDEIKPVAKKRELIPEEADSFEYELEKPDLPPVLEPRKRLGPSDGRVFWGRSGVISLLLIGLRKLSNFAYVISLPFFLLILLAIVMKERELAILGAVVIVLLNIVRFALEGFVLVSLAFKHGPVQGVLFFIPPITFYYLSKRGKVMQDATKRFLGPALPILGVVLLFAFVPWLRGGEPEEGESVGDRIQQEFESIQEKTDAKIKASKDPKE